MNKRLRKIADQLNISHLSSHEPQSLDMQRDQSVGDIYQVMQVMGHASDDQTREYL